MIESDIVIIGGGASGLMAAAVAVDYGKSVLVLEKNFSCGKKLLLTGKGRCNITNMCEWDDFASHIRTDSTFFKSAFYNFSNRDVLDFFNKIGLATKVERGMRAFPVSDKSSDVLSALINYLKKKNVCIKLGAEVLKVERFRDESSLFLTVLFDKKKTSHQDNHLMKQDYVLAKSVIMATGGLSYPLTGSTGDGYRMAQMLGHTIVPTYPSLTALIPKLYDKRISGTLLKNVRLDLYVNDILVQTEFGEVQFTDAGIEGALGFRVSRKAVRAISKQQKVILVIDMKPAVTPEELAARVTREVGNAKVMTVKSMLNQFLPFMLIPHFITLNPDLNLQNLPVRLKNWKFTIHDYVGYERAVITSGGVSLDEISRKTMESKILPGLFFAGEVMNLDADTGGYNLQIAFSTAALAAKNAALRVNNFQST